VILSGRYSLWQAHIISLLFKSVNLIAFIHGSEVSLGSIFARMLTENALKKIDRIIAVSNYTKSRIYKEILDSKNVEVIPNGISIDYWAKYRKVNKYKWNGYPNLLTIGGLSYRKGQHRLINALPAIIKVWPNVHYHVIGKSFIGKDLELLAKNNNVNDHVTFYGEVKDTKDIARAYKSADIFILLSENQPDGHFEGFGIVILEAGFFGLPSIGGIGCGVEDAISDSVNGKLVDGDNFDEIISAINQIMNNKKVYVNKSKLFIKDFLWENLIKKLIKS
jgi:phosphatidylinositol alpha-1,6-mannosyltransferase